MIKYLIYYKLKKISILFLSSKYVPTVVQTKLSSIYLRIVKVHVIREKK